MKRGRDECGSTNGVEKSDAKKSIARVDAAPTINLGEKGKNGIDRVCYE